MKQTILYFLMIAFSLNISKAQTLTVNNSQLNFGVVYENAPDSLPLTLLNSLDKSVNVTAFRFYSIYGYLAFSCSNTSFSIASGDSQTVWIKCAPQHNIFHNSELIIENDAQRGYISIDLVAQGRYSKNYYNASENLEEETLKTSLQTITGNGYHSLGYNTARDSMFMWLDNKKTNGQGATQNTLECVYTGRLATGYTNRTDCQTNDSFNTEHTFPQGFFNSNEPMRSDLHHLFPTDDDANNKRASYPFGVVTNASWSQGGSEFDNNTNIFEPRDIHKGIAARAMLYFVVRYANYTNFLDTQESILKTWNNAFVPSTIELTRNDDIYTIQNNRNPFVDYPQLADRITSFSNLSVAPTNFSIDETQNEINYGFVLNGSIATYQYVIVNNGNQMVQFSNFTLSNSTLLNFNGSSGTNTTLNPGEAITLTIDLHPTIPGVIYETLSFQTNVPGSLNVQIPINAQSTAVGVEEINSTTMFIYPNPTTSELTISGINVSLGNEIKVFDVIGKEVYSENVELSAVDEGYIKIQTTGFSTGVYLFTFSNNNNILYRHRFVKN